MIAPDRAIDRRPLAGGVPGATSEVHQNSLPAIQPSIGPPAQAVGDVVSHLAIVEAIEHDLGLAIRHIVAVAIRNEKAIAAVQQAPTRRRSPVRRWSAGAPVPKDGVPLGPAVVIGILENHDPIALRIVESDGDSA